MPPTVPLPAEDEIAARMSLLSSATTTVLEAGEKTTNEETPKSTKLPTLDELRASIPAECFKKSLTRSLAFLAWDVLLLAMLFLSVSYFEMLGAAGMLVWYFVTGMIGFSLFVVGHDCGHGTFSDYVWLNDIVGHIAHAPLLAPYWPWQKSHRLHHTFTSHLEKDKGHPWITEDKFLQWNFFQHFYANNPITGFIRWFVYTIAGVTDGSHFLPWSRLFTTTKERLQCVFSLVACISCAIIAFRIAGCWPVFLKYYIGAVISQGFWLTMVTYLQHRSDDITVYENRHWAFVKGQMETIDRPYGFGIDALMHHITDGHVAHHLFFTQIPHYHLMRATEALQARLQPLGVYKFEKRNFLAEFWRLNFRLEYLIGKGGGRLQFADKDTGDEEGMKKKNE